MTKEIKKSGNEASVEAKANLVIASGAEKLLQRIRPEWQARNLIVRTRKLLSVDPSSACQRLLNAAIFDLKNKILIAGIDIADKAASIFKLPSVTKEEDISENYSTAKIIELSYRIGILSRTEWKKIRRCYDIRGDLEHEDEEYEAGIDDILYIFKNCIEIVLEQDSVEIIRVDDIKDLVGMPEAPIVTGNLLEEYKHAPDVRQTDIIKHLINLALDPKKPDITRQNSMELLRQFQSITKNNVLVTIGATLQERYRQRSLDLVIMKVAHAAGVLPYLKQRKKQDFFESFCSKLEQVGYDWTSFSSHKELFDDFEDIGGIVSCPPKPRQKIILWMTLCYLGEPGGYGRGKNRKVFNSDVAAPKIQQIFKEASSSIKLDIDETTKDSRVKAAIGYQPIARRLETLKDLVADNE